MVWFGILNQPTLSVPRFMGRGGGRGGLRERKGSEREGRWVWENHNMMALHGNWSQFGQKERRTRDYRLENQRLENQRLEKQRLENQRLEIREPETRD